MDELIISFSKEFKGYSFGLDPLNSHKLNQVFPKTKQMRVISVRNDKNEPWQTFESTLINHLLPALTGLNQEQLSSISKITLQEPLGKKHLLITHQGTTK